RSLRYQLETEDGDAILMGTLAPAPGRRLAPAEPGVPTSLSAGTSYVLRLSADAPSDASCVQVAGLRSDLSLGPQLIGLRTTAVRSSTDRGESWRLEPATTLAAALTTRTTGRFC